MEHGFKFHWVLMGAGAVIAGKIIASALANYLKFSM
jgi:hypothetical protein